MNLYSSIRQYLFEVRLYVSSACELFNVTTAFFKNHFHLCPTSELDKNSVHVRATYLEYGGI